jgi:hypothetical protein
LVAALGLAACSAGERETGSLHDGGGPDGSPPGESGNDGDGDGDGDEGSGDHGDEGDGDGDDAKFDTGYGGDTPGGGPGDGQMGCQKVDFLFVVDNSGSMEDEQANLIASFPGFIATIEKTLEAEDFRVMVVDTDAYPASTTVWCVPDPDCCEEVCADSPAAICNDVLCTPPAEACDAVLGAGRNDDLGGDPCPISGDNRYMIDGQPDLTGTFDCAARVGTWGSGNERPMQAMEEALTTESEPGGCNEGFVRKDAILVVTVITDEEDDPNDADTGAGPDPNSPGDPESWMQTVAAVKGGDETAAVVLALVGDTDLPSGICEPLAEDGVDTVGAEPAPRLRRFAELFTYGQWCSVCAPDYTPCFEDAVSVIDMACDEFEPPP